MADSAPAVLFGAAGRMGQELLRQAWRYDALHIARGYDKVRIGEVAETLVIEDEPDRLAPEIKLVIDFSAADAVLTHLDLALAAGVPFLTGVTGLADDVLNELRAAANEIPVLYSPNMSPGMNVMIRLSALAARALPNFERHIVEVHHTQKQDAPSGTALHLAAAVDQAAGDETPVTALRMGDVIGEHRFLLGGPGERLEIIHRADSRAVFAAGALRAAAWLLKKSPGFYKMADVLET